MKGRKRGKKDERKEIIKQIAKCKQLTNLDERQRVFPYNFPL